MRFSGGSSSGSVQQGDSVANTSLSHKCGVNSDTLYDRELVLKELDSFLKKSNSYYKEFSFMGFFVYDLTDPPNFYKSERQGVKEEGCINFINHHLYHFAPASLPSSTSHILFLEDGKLKVFEAINCPWSKDKLTDVVRYVQEKPKDDQNKENTLTRLKHYRRYGTYWTVDSTEYTCGEEPPPNSDKLYSRRSVLYQFRDSLVTGPVAGGQKIWPRLIEADRAIGFFVYDLTEPVNKQTSMLERIEFKNNHVYHFASIDSPFSFSNIAVLEDGKLKIFKAVNCEGKGDSLEDVIRYLNDRVKQDPRRNEIINQVRNFREYGVYVSDNDLSKPQCEILVGDKSLHDE
jgi:hypothetical protein